jgi:alpha-L-fucosidase
MHRRSFVQAGALAAGLPALRLFPRLAPPAPRALPSPAQLRWQRDELALFFHVGVNTFTDREWGDGTESPTIFDPPALDTRQWARAASRGGFRSMILTAKHHDGFCLWPTGTTGHSVAASPWRGGQGDLVREFVDACRADGLRPGLYLSPWDRNHPAYGDSPRYNDVYAEQLTELLTRYGPIAEMWFDGANGEGPNGKRQEYDWPRFFGLVRRHQPEAVIFSDAGPDVRWCGNERGEAGDPNWSPVDPTTVPVPGATGDGVEAALQHGDPSGPVWRPAESDVSIRPGWFHHPAEDDQVRSVDDLVRLYLTSVGRNAKLLLNVPPTRRGLLADQDVARLAGFRDRLAARFATDLADAGRLRWHRTSGRTGIAELTLPKAVMVETLRLEERIERGQAVARFVVQAANGSGWTTLAGGTTIGNARLLEVPATPIRRLRLAVIDAVWPPLEPRIRLYGPAS